jgi:hypothetical protein
MQFFSKFLELSEKIQYKTIILPDHIYAEIQKLQRELSYKDDKIHSITDTINLLLRFCIDKENYLIFVQDYPFLRSYLDEKKSFLDEFISSVFISAH